MDWRIGGAISKLVLSGRIPSDEPLLMPAPAVLPVTRLVLWRAGAASARDVAQTARRLCAEDNPLPGLCPADFHFDDDEVRQVFNGHVVVYSP